MLAPNDVRITGLRCVEPESGSAAGVVAAGSALWVVMSVEAGTALHATGARFCAGIQADGLEMGPDARREGWLGEADWTEPVGELRLRIPGEVTAHLGDRLLTVAEVAGVMRVSTMTVYRLIKSGELPALRVGKNYRIRESEVDRYLLDRQVEGA